MSTIRKVFNIFASARKKINDFSFSACIECHKFRLKRRKFAQISVFTFGTPKKNNAKAVYRLAFVSILEKFPVDAHAARGFNFSEHDDTCSQRFMS